MEPNEKEQRKYTIIEKIVNEQITKKDAARELELSIKQIGRLVDKFKTEGKEGFIHKNRGKPNQKKDLNIIKELEDLYLTDFLITLLRPFMRK